jgi:hypothetical protein
MDVNKAQNWLITISLLLTLLGGILVVAGLPFPHNTGGWAALCGMAVALILGIVVLIIIWGEGRPEAEK